MKIHILILNYNGADLLKAYLPSFIAATGVSKHSCRVSIIDNNSADDSFNVVESFQGKVGWIGLKDNRVLCAYNEAALALDDDVLILMNNDIRVDENFVDPLVGRFENDQNIFMVTPRCMSIDDSLYEGSRTRGGLRYGVYWSSARFPWHEEGIFRTGKTLQAGFGAFDRKKFLALNGYDDLYLPGRLEDADICFRAYKRGWMCLYEPASVVYHAGGVSFHKRFGAKKTLVINWRNTFLFMLKNLSTASTLWRFLFWLPLRLIYSLVTFRTEFILGLLAAIPLAPRAYRGRIALKKEGFFSGVPDRVIFKESCP
ncbi:MAG: hypothetical protein A3C47_04575 [Omnitrophica bacterium RIFCSPHIGHO2_02_FULL_51_18]|nr:MAG: hypothetical protein A3C47_04575 [Omnitrophica bacterium RIFCSPHIGHO2_02_FULL_51_18]